MGEVGEGGEVGDILVEVIPTVEFDEGEGERSEWDIESVSQGEASEVRRDVLLQTVEI